MSITRYIVAAVLIALAYVALVFITPGEPVITIKAENVSEAMFDDLLAQGYTGIDDGMEALYVPRSVAVSSCYTDKDCELAFGE